MSNSFVALFCGAAVGALLAYAGIRVSSELEDRARRSTLLNQLATEINQFGREMQPYDVGKVFYQDPIRFLA